MLLQGATRNPLDAWRVNPFTYDEAFRRSPWGQMSFWGATVITNLFSAIPWGIGDWIVTLMGWSVDNATQSFFSLHYLLPFVIVGVVVLHIWALHVHGSNNPIGIATKGEQDVVPFAPLQSKICLDWVCF